MKTQRLLLRSPELSDAARIAELADDEGVARMTTRMPHPYDIEDAQQFLTQAASRDPAEEALFALTTSADGLIGMAGLYPNGGFGPEIGFWLGRPYWGLGYATEATEALLAWAAADWRTKIVVAGHFSDNPASGAALSKAGFLYTGEVQVRHSMARGEAAPTRMMIWLA